MSEDLVSNLAAADLEGEGSGNGTIGMRWVLEMGAAAGDGPQRTVPLRHTRARNMASPLFHHILFLHPS